MLTDADLKLAASLARVFTVQAAHAEVLRIAREFVERVERGEIRSVTTYSKFKAALQTIDSDTGGR